MSAVGPAPAPARARPWDDASGPPEPLPDLRLLPAAAGAWVTAWAALVLTPVPAAVVAVCLASGAVLALRRRHAVVVALLLGASAAAGASAFGLARLERGPVAGLGRAEARVEVELVVTGDPRPAGEPGHEVLLLDGRVQALVDGGGTTSTRTPVLVLVPGDPGAWSGLAPGTRVAAHGRLQPARRADDVAAVLVPSGRPRTLAPPGAVLGAAQHLRNGLRRAVAPLGPDVRGLLPALVVGDVSALPTDLKNDFRTTGMTHLTAVSGTNCTIVCAVLLALVRRTGLGVRLAPVVAAVGLVGFVVLARPEASVLRAAAMGGVGLLALVGGRRRPALPALGTAVLVLLLVDPWLSRSVGFALSVAATGGLVVLVPPLSAALESHMSRVRERLPRRARTGTGDAGSGGPGSGATDRPALLAGALAVPVAAQLACAPLLALLGAGVGLVSLPANLLAAPAVAPATVLGVAATAAAPVSEPAAQVLAGLAAVPTWWIVQVARTGARSPVTALPWPQGPAGAVSLAALLVLAGAGLLVLRAWYQDRSASPPAATEEGRARLLPLVAAALVLLLVAGLVPRLRHALPVGGEAAWPPPDWRVVACDVGQGDAVVLNAGAGQGLVVDAGPDSAAVDRCLGDLGVVRVPLLVLTHAHADHVDGLDGVLDAREVDQVGLSPVQGPPEEGVACDVDEAGVPRRVLSAGVTGTTGGISWQVLSPLADAPADDAGADHANDASVVLLADVGGVRVLLPGDLEPDGQAALLARGGTGPVDVLKVPHHGSAHQDPDLLSETVPRVALVSVGVGNPYGHPAASALAALGAAGTVVGRTDTDGDLAVAGTADALRLVRRGR